MNTDHAVPSHWLPTHTDPLFVQAMDQRDSFGKMLFDIPDDNPTGTQRTAMEQDKLLVWAGLQQALPTVTGGRPGILVDEQYGQAVIDSVRAARDAGSPIQLAIPIEQSGRDWFTLQWGDAWLDHLHRIQPDFVKILVRDNPYFDPAHREKQLHDLAAVSAALQASGFPLLYELLVPATPDQLDRAGGNTSAFDRDLRPELTTRLIADNYAHDIEPSLWKLEGYETLDAASTVAAQAHASGRTTGLIVLGRNAPVEQVRHWLDIARQIPSYVGFAIGRSVWREVLLHWEASTHRKDDRAAAEAAVARGYEQFVADWLEG